MKLITTAFFMMDTHGVPLPMQVAYALDKKVAISMPHFCRDALAAGWTWERTRVRLEEALVDAGVERLTIDAMMTWLEKTRGRELPCEG